MDPPIRIPYNPDPLQGVPQFTKVMNLGIGSFGSVALYQRDEGRGEPSLCAVKFMPRSGPTVDVNLIQREIQSHRVLRHPHVIRFKQLGLTPSHIYMCMEYADQGDLLGFLRRKGPLPEADARWLFQQIIFGLDYCHLKGVVNRDLKPENLLLKLTPEASKRHRRHQMQEREQQMKAWEQLKQMHLLQYGQLGDEQQRQQQQLAPAGAATAAAAVNGSGVAASPRASPAPPAPAQVPRRPPPLPPPPVLPPIGVFDHRTSTTFNLHIKIADFGLSKRAAHSLPKTRVGTINYMAPEVLLAGPNQRYDGHKADIWSAGVVLYAMLFSRVPFESIQEQAAAAAAATAATNAQQYQGGARDRAATIQRILSGDWAVPPGMSVSPQVLHLLTQMLVPDPVRRISMQAIMEHPWFRAGLPAAALTMNTALVRQQAAQGLASAGDQTEADIDLILEELRNQAAAESQAAMASALAASCSRSSDDAAEERRAFEVRALSEEEPVPPAAAAGAAGGAGARRAPQVRGPPLMAAVAGAEVPAMHRLSLGTETQRRYNCVDVGGAGGAGAEGGGEGRNSPRGAVPRTVAGAPPPAGARPALSPAAAAGPNAFLARLACLGPGDVAAAGSGGAGGGAAAGSGGAGYGPVVLTPESSMSRRAEALDNIDFIAGRG